MIHIGALRRLDAADPLRAFRDRFELPAGFIYLDGNSLGPSPKAAAGVVQRVVTSEWGEGLIRSWNDAGWIDAPRRIGGKIAPLIGAKPSEVVVADSTSVNLFKLLAAAVTSSGRRLILTEPDDFPTDGYVAEGVARLIPGARAVSVPRQHLAEALSDEVAVLLLSHVHYKTAQRHDMAALTAAAHAAGALAMWDLSHSVGAVRVDLNGCGADLAVGCGYKFLNGGPGAPAFVFVAESRQEALANPLSGWMGHAQPFAFEPRYRPADGVGRWLTGTPPILGLAALEAGVELALEPDIEAIEAKSAALFDLFADLVGARLAGAGFALISPQAAAERGSHIAFRHQHGFAIMQALIARGVIGDFRDPDVLRFGLTPLYLSFEDVWRAVDTLAEVMADESWRETPPRRPGQVT
ncbi:MAG TPA: kynureninase [Caulobacteraceae bacterium]|nr:kynureninase [Caulobacteraceae bacterium]